jgi:hypothetical protein
MNEEAHEKTSRAGYLWIIFGVIFAYPLSIGPVFAIAQRTSMDVEWLEEVYTPIIWLHEHTIFKRPLELYVELWGVK